MVGVQVGSLLWCYGLHMTMICRGETVITTQVAFPYFYPMLSQGLISHRENDNTFGGVCLLGESSIY